MKTPRLIPPGRFMLVLLLFYSCFFLVRNVPKKGILDRHQRLGRPLTDKYHILGI